MSARLARPAFADPSLALESDEAPPRSQETSTDEAGAFTLAVDPGAHALLITPPVERGLPALETEVQVPALGAGVSQDLSLPPAAALVLQLTDRADTPAAEVAVEVWAVEADEERLVAQGLTDEAGGVVLVLPNPGAAGGEPQTGP